MKADTMSKETFKIGYKRTETGLIPEDWEVKKLGEVANVDPENLSANTSPDYSFRYISLDDVDRGTLLSYSEQTFRTSPSRARRVVRKGDILVSTVRPNLKSHFYVKHEVIDTVCSTGFSVVRCKPCVADPAFVLHHFFAGGVEKQIDTLLTGSNYPAINSNDVRSLHIPLPALREQRAIAEVLSDADALLEALDRLIAKKRDIKQGAMQALLTGQVRLPGFSGEWQTEQLDDLGTTYGGLAGKSKEDFEAGMFPYIPFLNILNNPVVDPHQLDFVRIKSGEKQNKALRGDLFFNGSSETPNEVGLCSVLMDDIPNLYLNSFCFGFRLNGHLGTNPLFLVYFFRSNGGRELLYSLAQGATRYNLSKRNFLKLRIPFPSINEQDAIVEVLTDMDAEIEALEKRRAKLHALKQGMMQELLTGRTRLVEPGEPTREVTL